MTEYDSYKYNPEAATIQGTRWAEEEEIKRATRRIWLSDSRRPIRSGLPVISNGDTVYVDDSDVHSLIIGSTGSKKTRLFGMPMLEIIRRSGESAVVTDPKGELYDLTAASFEKTGYTVYTINLRDPLHSDGWNPLLQARIYLNAGNEDKAVGIVNDFASAFIAQAPGSRADPFWTQSARAMLQGLAMMMVEGQGVIADQEVNLQTLRTLSDHLALEPKGNEITVKDLLPFYPEDSLARSNLEAILNGSDRTFDNIKVSYSAPMQRLYMQKSLVAMLSGSGVVFENLGRKKTVLYIIMPDEKTTLHAVVSLIIKQCYEALIDLAQKCSGAALPVRVNFLLDEFSNLPPIPDMAAMISAARSRNIKFHLIIQGLYQLSSKYGADDAHTIKGNCGNWAFLTSRELPLLNEISDLCGSDPLTGRRLITTSQLQRLNKEKGEVLILLGRQYPFISHLADISEYTMPRYPGKRPFPSLRQTDAEPLTMDKIIERFRQLYPGALGSPFGLGFHGLPGISFEDLMGGGDDS